MTLVICICTYNRNLSLIRCLKSINNLFVVLNVKIIIIVVDNSINYNSFKLVKKLKKSFKYKIIQLHEKRRGVVYARNKCLNKVKKITNIKDVSMADAEQVKGQTGFSIGGVSPVAHLNKIKILIDSSFSRYENVYAAAGHPNSIFKISYKQLIKLTEGIEEDIVL